MGALLIAEWLDGDERVVEVRDEAAAAVVRARVAEVADEVGLDGRAAARLGLAATELATNQVRHARSGVISVRAIERLGTWGVEVIAADGGPGMADLAAALRGRDTRAPAASSGGLGVGVSALTRNADELDVDTRLGEGTCLRVRTFATAPAARSEVAVVARAIAGEQVSGDHAVVVRTPSVTTFAVFDGLGHGPPAREAANRGVATVRGSAAAGARPDEILQACDHVLQGTRGASAAVAAVDHRRGVLTWCAAGDVTGTVCGADRATMRLAGAARILGTRGRGARLTVEMIDLGERDVLCIATDGIVSRAVVDDDPLRLRHHPALLAQHVADTWARGTDDLLVLVAR